MGVDSSIYWKSIHTLQSMIISDLVLSQSWTVHCSTMNPLTFLLFSSTIHILSVLRTELTIMVKSQSQECFFFASPKVGQVVLDYAIIDGPANSSIDFGIVAPFHMDSKVPIYHRDSSAGHVVDDPSQDYDGDYKFCFYNRNQFGTITVYFYIEFNKIIRIKEIIPVLEIMEKEDNLENSHLAQGLLEVVNSWAVIQLFLMHLSGYFQIQAFLGIKILVSYIFLIFS